MAAAFIAGVSLKEIIHKFPRGTKLFDENDVLTGDLLVFCAHPALFDNINHVVRRFRQIPARHGQSGGVD
jgi:hypothetical protein